MSVLEWRGTNSSLLGDIMLKKDFYFSICMGYTKGCLGICVLSLSK